MDPRDFLNLSPTHLPHRWVLPVGPSLCTPAGYLFGGAALGASLIALEEFTGRPPVWATAQYLAFARPDHLVDIDVRVAAAGRRITQARAVGHVGEREILTVNAALGADPFEPEAQWAGMPDLSSPETCPPLSRGWPGETILGDYDIRIALGRDVGELDGRPGDGRSALWVRLPEGVDVSVATLAVLGDGLTFGIGQLLGMAVAARNLDNTLRICRLVPTRWCCSTSSSTPCTAASLMGRCTCGPRTAPCSPAPASPASWVTGPRPRPAPPRTWPVWSRWTGPRVDPRPLKKGA